MARVHAVFFLVVLSTTGCHSTPKQPPMTVHVRDAETKEPIVGATVDLSKLKGTPIAKQVTTAGGVAQLTNPSQDDDGYLDVSAKGYLTEARPVYALKDSPPAAGAVAQAQAVEIELYAAPQPAVELMIPTGFRGLIKVEFKVTADDGHSRPRLFPVAVSADGTAQIVGPSIIHAVTPQDVRAVRPDGTALPTGGPADAVQLRWVKTTEQMDYFVFGTQSECGDARKSIDPEDKGSGGGGGGKGGGRKGGGGRHGGGRGMGGGGMGGGGMGGMGGGMGR
ncbi:hypothetical protein [Limnoglobus roseus]|uniref:Carboxypeptidase regulatory-like domain-containing protein n=1 Tax=Limnoglobus roseus TaxID=2598579 RepID=A0A5C1AGD1_9BACT|nr:hypothetical protein [Limnoglobus roseus]QEL16174.1 carboxypeptidase regulatory-like domain-containing protein [Limnoglobus roseus]